MREYLTPDFDINVYEIEDIITLSIVTVDPDDNGSGEAWW